MKKFLIEIRDQEDQNRKKIAVECITFAEAAQHAYSAKNRLGLDWKIISVQLDEKKERKHGK